MSHVCVLSFNFNLILPVHICCSALRHADVYYHEAREIKRSGSELVNGCCLVVYLCIAYSACCVVLCIMHILSVVIPTSVQMDNIVGIAVLDGVVMQKTCAGIEIAC